MPKSPNVGSKSLPANMKLELTSAELGRLAEIMGYLRGVADIHDLAIAREHAKWLEKFLDRLTG